MVDEVKEVEVVEEPTTGTEEPTAELTEEELLEKAKKLETQKYENFIKEYNQLCDKYGYQIQPRLNLEVVKK